MQKAHESLPPTASVVCHPAYFCPLPIFFFFFFVHFLQFRRGNVLSRCEQLLSRTTSLFKWSPGYPGPPPPRGPILGLHTPLPGLFAAFRVLLMFMFLRQPCAGKFCSCWEGEQKGIMGRQGSETTSVLFLLFHTNFKGGYYQRCWTAARVSMSRNRRKMALSSPKQIHIA